VKTKPIWKDECVTEVYWQAKIWGLLHDPALKALHGNSGRGGNSFWQDLEVMQTWKENGWNPEESSKKIFKHIKLADYITSASDRGAIGSLSTSINYNENGLEISHLLSGEKLNLKVAQHQELIANRLKYLQSKEVALKNLIPETIKKDPQKLFWWLWRCLPEATCQLFNDETLLLMPAETRLPDSSIWSHASLTAALAGALAGYNLTTEDLQKDWLKGRSLSHPYLASFSFSPVQELIKASRKMRDFWAGSWLLHYLSAKVSWKLAHQYGPDCLLYPNLYQQPLIDRWLLNDYPEFNTWIEQPTERALLTAGFPNVIVIILPKEKVAAAMQTAKNELIATWREVGKLVLEELQDNRHWMRDLSFESNTWQGWLDSQWQTYWTGVPIGKEKVELKSSEIYQEERSQELQWTQEQNKAYNLVDKKALFLEAELNFLQEAAKFRWERYKKHAFSANVGSWWPHIFDQTRFALAAVKNARDWELPTAFGPRSTVSGLGSVVHTGDDWISEGETKKYWQRHAGLFDGIEQLNATEVLKRGLHKILPKLLKLPAEKIAASYPDLTCGVAGYLKITDDRDRAHFHQTCRDVMRLCQQETTIDLQAWGIPWIDEHHDSRLKSYHPRLLDAGWLVEDLDIDEDLVSEYRKEIQQLIDSRYPNNNPADWYVIAAGDGDGMSDWLKGNKLKSYRDYIPQNLKVESETFKRFLDSPKRMGPSTHNALSRALLDFSNQLVPYLTEKRYAGRLIYGGGDDVLAYTNLWEWDSWLWDIRQCFRGANDAKEEFISQGDYWRWNCDKPSQNLATRPLFTMGGEATISFGTIIAHHSVPLAIALENLWEAEEEAKEHFYLKNGQMSRKDAVQVRVLYGNGNILKATAKFDVFHQWQQLLNLDAEIESSIFERVATVWNQHPVPTEKAIASWTKAFCTRRDTLPESLQTKFEESLINFLIQLWQTTTSDDRDREVQNWLKLAAFVLRNREIKLGGQN
jgi:CRISPR-associated protein Cmr2